MATTNLIIKTIGDINIEHGNGTPDHTSNIGSIYINLDTGIHYRNDNGTSSWNEDETLSIANLNKLEATSGTNSGDQNALTVPYDNTVSGLTAIDVKNAIDEVYATALGSTSGGGGSVSSVFGRTGAVIAESGDYTASQVTNAFDKTTDDTDDITEGVNKFTTQTDINKLAGIEAGAEVNVNTDWASTSGDSEILNKPTDITDLSTHSVTELNDVTNAGSGLIITSSERTDLNNNTTHRNTTSGNPHNVQAFEVPFTPNGDILSSDVQTAIVELRDDTDTKLSGKANTSHTHTVSDVTDFATGVTDNETQTSINISGVNFTYNSEDGTDAFQIGTSNIFQEAINSTPSIANLENHLSFFHSAGLSSGGIITGGTDGTISVSSGFGIMRETTDPLSPLKAFSFSAESGANVALVDNTSNFIYAEYNTGSPRLIATTSERTEYQTNVLIGEVYREGTTLHINQETQLNGGDHATQMQLRMWDTMPFAHASGGILSDNGDLTVLISLGKWWEGFNNFTTPQIDTSVSDTFSYYYRDGSGGWTKVASQTDIDPTKYDDNSGTLANMGTGGFGVHWVYIGIDGDVDILYGEGSYLSQDEAQGATIPSTVPNLLQAHSRLLGRIISQQGQTTLTGIESVFTSIFTGGTGSTNDHNELLNIGVNTHADIDSHISSTLNPHSVTKTQVGLSNVPNTDATLRSNHTGTQLANTISDIQTTITNNTEVLANTAKVSADGSVTTHSDVTSAGSGIIITTTERNNLNLNTTHRNTTSGNPHNVQAFEVPFASTVGIAGTDVAEALDENYSRVKGVFVDDTNIANNNIIKYNSSSGNLEYVNKIRDNHTLVKSLADFPTPISGVITLVDNYSYEINGTVNISPNRIETGISNIIYGVDKSDDIIVSTTTGSLITNNTNDLSIDKITLSAPLGKCFDCTSTILTNRVQMKDVIFANSQDVGMFANYATIVFENNLLVGNVDGIKLQGTNGDFLFVDNVIEFNSGSFIGVESTTGSFKTIYVDRSKFSVDNLNQIALVFSENLNLTGGGAIISNCAFENGNDDISNYLIGITGNSPGWTLSAGNNVNLPGLRKENIPICTGAYTTTSTTFGQVPETHVIKTKTFYEKKSRFMTGKLTAALSHSQNGRDTEIDLYNLTDNVAVTGSTLSALITSSGVYQIVESGEFTLADNKEYRVRIRRVTGNGNSTAEIRSATLELKVY